MQEPMKIPDEIAREIMDCAEKFQRKLTRMAATAAEQDGRGYMNQNDIDIALVLLLTKDATDNWSKS